jgi:hypothetical protein
VHYDGGAYDADHEERSSYPLFHRMLLGIKFVLAGFDRDAGGYRSLPTSGLRRCGHGGDNDLLGEIF